MWCVYYEKQIILCHILQYVEVTLKCRAPAGNKQQSLFSISIMGDVAYSFITMPLGNRAGLWVPVYRRTGGGGCCMCSRGLCSFCSHFPVTGQRCLMGRNLIWLNHGETCNGFLSGYSSRYINRLQFIQNAAGLQESCTERVKHRDQILLRHRGFDGSLA